MYSYTITIVSNEMFLKLPGIQQDAMHGRIVSSKSYAPSSVLRLSSTAKWQTGFEIGFDWNLVWSEGGGSTVQERVGGKKSHRMLLGELPSK